MSDVENTKSKGKGGVSAWSEHEVLVYLLSAIEHNGVKIDFANSPTPLGRNANGCVQKMFKIKNAFRAEIDAIKSGVAIEGPVDATPKKTPARKRKGAAADDDGEDTPKKRGRAKKSAAPEAAVKDEPEGEQKLGVEVEA